MGGRHSYGGYCSHQGVILDSALLKGLQINWQEETITMQVGVIWDEVYKALNGSEYVAIGGLCPTVEVVGFTLGGGYNSMYTRSFGLALDNVLNFTVALYNGTIDVLEMIQKIHRISETKLSSGQISFFNITWKNQDLKAVLLNWVIFLEEIANIDIRISFDMIVYISSERRFIMMWGTFNGPQAELKPLFNPWLAKSPQPDSFTVLNYTQTDIIRELAALINSFSDISFDIAPGFVWLSSDADQSAIDIAESWLQRLLNAAEPTKSIVGAYLNYIEAKIKCLYFVVSLTLVVCFEFFMYEL